MKANGIIFIVGFILAFTSGYIFFPSDGTATQESSVELEENDTANQQEQDTEEELASVPSEAEPLSNNNCLSCHAVESLNAPGGSTGPDLSDAFTEVANKHGKELNEFLQEPTSAVMSSVIGDDPLSDEERAAIVEALELAAQQ